MGYRAGVVGAAGFAGIELVRLLSRHPEFDLAAATSDALAGTPIAKAYPAFTGVTDLAFSTHEDTDFSAFDVVFLAVPHKAAMGMAPDLIAAGVTVVDLSDCPSSRATSWPPRPSAVLPARPCSWAARAATRRPLPLPPRPPSARGSWTRRRRW